MQSRLSDHPDPPLPGRQQGDTPSARQDVPFSPERRGLAVLGCRGQYGGRVVQTRFDNCQELWIVWLVRAGQRGAGCDLREEMV